MYIIDADLSLSLLISSQYLTGFSKASFMKNQTGTNMWMRTNRNYLWLVPTNSGDVCLLERCRSNETCLPIHWGHKVYKGILCKNGSN